LEREYLSQIRKACIDDKETSSLTIATKFNFINNKGEMSKNIVAMD